MASVKSHRRRRRTPRLDGAQRSRRNHTQHLQKHELRQDSILPRPDLQSGAASRRSEYVVRGLDTACSAAVSRSGNITRLGDFAPGQDVRDRGEHHRN